MISHKYQHPVNDLSVKVLFHLFVKTVTVYCKL